MSTSARRPLHRRRLRAGVIVVALVAGGLASLAPAGASHGDVSLPGSNFEIDTNANLKVDHPAPPSLDWANVEEDRQADAPSGQTDDSFTQGAKEDTAVPAISFGSIPPNKSDLLNFGVYFEETGSGDFLHVFWHRVQEPNGTTNMDFEFNQSEALTANGVTPVRTPGDILIQYDLAQGGTNPELFLSRWIDGSDGETKDDCEASNTLPCWGDRVNLSDAGDATGSINTSAIPAGESDGLGDVSARTFGEATVDFNALVGETDECFSFGSAYLKSRSSDSFTAALKDFIAPVGVDIENCGEVKVVKTDDADPPNLLDGAEFDLIKDEPPTAPDDGQTAPGPEDTEVVDSCTTVAGECLFEEVFQGNYWVVETVAPEGHDLADPPHQAVTVVATETVTVEFENPRQRGAIVISKTRKHAAAPGGEDVHAGVDFTVTDSEGAVVPGGVVTTDAQGQACVDGLLFADYTVTEAVPAGYVAGSDNPQTVTVDNKADCGGLVGDAEQVSFVNVPLTDLTVTVDSQVDGGTSSSIDCGLSDPEVGEDITLSETDLEPGTYTCTVVIDP